MRSRLGKGAAAILAAALAAALLAPSAPAHVVIVETTPSVSARTSQRFVAVLFSGPIRGGALVVFGPDGSKASKGGGGRDPRNVSRLLTSLRGGLKAGRYTARVNWTAADGHQQEAGFHFRLVN